PSANSYSGHDCSTAFYPLPTQSDEEPQKSKKPTPSNHDFKHQYYYNILFTKDNRISGQALV
ncbi:hypothetical protein NR402_17200, partial [Acidithiobacillus ferrooxidans]|uniref:hypothetical protein n=1 Tax=Acidithiobacillus ferrooxidans TaxID=920 RepID=UPI00214AF4CE